MAGPVSSDWRAWEMAEPATCGERVEAAVESGPGVLIASGYISGGAIAGIAFAIMSRGLAPTSAAIDAADPVPGADSAVVDCGGGAAAETRPDQTRHLTYRPNR